MAPGRGSQGKAPQGQKGMLSHCFFICVTLVSLLTVLLPYEMWIRPHLEAANLLFWVRVFVPDGKLEPLPPPEPVLPASPQDRVGDPPASGLRGAAPAQEDQRSRSGALPTLSGSLDLSASISSSKTRPAAARVTRTGRCPGQERGADASSSVFPLELVGIPKTGATWLEDCSTNERDEGKWGSKHPELKKQIVINSESKWQCQASAMPPSLLSTFNNRQVGETFCVVRDPFDRLLSMASNNVPRQQCTAETLNKKVMNFLQGVAGDSDGKPKPYFSGCALLPQAAFVYGWNERTFKVNKTSRSCTHVLRYDNLVDDFNRLMEAKGYPYRLAADRIEGLVKAEKGCFADLTVADFKPQVRELVYSHFRDDFEMLGRPVPGQEAASASHRQSRCWGQPENQQMQLGSRLDPISFIHIPRTGGTNISGCTIDEESDEQRWGMHNNVLNKNIMANKNEKSPERCWGFSAPPSIQQHYFGSKETFCVVRDPYERLISELELHYAQSLPKVTHPCDPESLNRRLVQWLLDMKGAHSRVTPKPYSRSCHLLPQAAYVHGWMYSGMNGRVDRSRKSCKHVLIYDNLNADFNALMEARGYPYRLNGDVEESRSQRSCTGSFTADDLWPEALTLIEEVYKDDFDLLGFQARPAPRRDINRRIGVCKDQERAPEPWPADQKDINPITLIHIPRTGGTSTEECTANEVYGDYTWGNMAAGVHFKRFFNKHPGTFCWGQHVPPNLGMTFFDNKETFCMVRNPYDRMISEYGFRQEFYAPASGKACDPESLDKHIISSLKQVLGHSGKGNPYLHDCHLLPQAAFVYGWNENTERVDRNLKNCHRILRYERIAEDFNGLMEERGYPYRLIDHKKVDATKLKKAMRSPKACANMTRKVLTPQARKLMAEVWKDDFELFGYDPDK